MSLFLMHIAYIPMNSFVTQYSHTYFFDLVQFRASKHVLVQLVDILLF